jgi:Transcription factor WhiB
VPWTVYSERPATRAAARALITSPQLSDAALAIESGTSTSTIGLIRARLVSIGVIEAIPPQQRQQRPRPRRQDSPTALAIAAGCSTPAEVAAFASVSLQAAHKALQRTRPKLTELAAATSRLHVTKHEPACEVCHAPYTPDPSRGGHPQRYCGEDCRAEAKRERERARSAARHASPRQPPRQDPRPPQFPPPPDWSRGLCTTVPQRMRSWWTSADRSEREAAARMCAGCPVLEPCRAWSTAALPMSDSSVWAGMSAAERARRRREYLRELARQALKGYRR